MNEYENKENVDLDTNKDNTVNSGKNRVFKETKANKYPATFNSSDSKNGKSKVQQDQKIRIPLQDKTKQVVEEKAVTILKETTTQTTLEEEVATTSEVEEEVTTLEDEIVTTIEETEVVRRSPASERQRREEEPLFIQEEQEPIINIHHREQHEREILTTPEEAHKIRQKQVQLDKLKKKGQDLQHILSELHQEFTRKNKLLQEQNEINKLKKSIAALEARDEENEIVNKELTEMIGQLNEKGLEHQRKYEEKEQEINRLVNILSETRFKIKEIP